MDADFCMSTLPWDIGNAENAVLVNIVFPSGCHCVLICVMPLSHYENCLPNRHELTIFDNFFDSYLKRNRFVKFLTNSYSS